MADKKYCGSGKIKEFQNGNKMMRLSFNEKDVDLLRAELKNGWVNVNVCARKEPSKNGETHYGYIDDWTPTRRDGPPMAGSEPLNVPPMKYVPNPPQAKPVDDAGLPF